MCAVICLSLCLIMGCDGDEKWNKTINDNRISIVQAGEYLEITVFIPEKNLGDFEDPDSLVVLLDEAFADYLKLSDDAEFECPGLETVTERKEKDGGRTTLFRIPKSVMKVNRK